MYMCISLAHRWVSVMNENLKTFNQMLDKNNHDDLDDDEEKQ